MLIEFSVANYRSILERQTLSMAASSYFKELESLNTFIPDQDDGVPRLLRSTVLYGPNASGKSTLIQALQLMEGQVLNSQKESQAGDAIDVVAFKLTAESRAADSEFEIAFVEQGVRYEYGFRCNQARFTEEWLFAYPLGRAQKWFHRVFDAEAGKDVYKFSTSFLGGKTRHSLWKEQTRPNALFFSTRMRRMKLVSKARSRLPERATPCPDWSRPSDRPGAPPAPRSTRISHRRLLTSAAARV